MRDTYVTVRGNVIDQPRVVVTNGGTVLTKFRLGSTPSHQRAGQWEKGNTSFYDVTCFRKLGENVAASLVPGDGVLVHGRLEVREWAKDDRFFKDVQITAECVGHDLTFGITVLKRPEKVAPPVPAFDEFREEDDATEAA